MMRLLKHGLIFAELFPVDTPAMVARYNIALKKLTGRQTNLTEFMVDISGYAPEIGQEFGDDAYLNPGGVNRQFILLSVAQKACPLLNAHFSTSHQILKDFIEENEAQLFALTARDAVAGELDNSVFSVVSAHDLFDIRKITVSADTSGSHLQDAAKLHAKIDRFMSEPDAWHDDVLVAEMISLSKQTGDVTKNPVLLTQTTYEQRNFFTEHFGGLYVFRDTDTAGAISRRPKEQIGRLPVRQQLDFEDRRQILSFLYENGLVESIIEAKGKDAAAILRQRLDFILIATAADAGIDVSNLSRAELQTLHRRSLSGLPTEYAVIADVVRWIEQGGRRPTIPADHPAAFYVLRGRAGSDRDLVNMLIAELAPFDVRQLYITHKQAFLAAYTTWPEAKKEYVAQFLAREYLMDKAGARVTLFGHEDPMPKGAARIGPWGAPRA